MSESLTSRVGRIVAGGFHAMLDAVENASPEQVLEQAIREVDAAIADVRTDLGRVEAQRHLTAKRLAEDSARQEALADQAREAVRQQRDDLAEAAIERQIDLEAQMPVLEARLSELGDDKSRLEGYITALQAKKREMRQALDDFRAAREQQASPTGTATGGDHRGESVQARTERATDAFDRIFKRQTGLAGTSGVSDGTAAKLAELEDLARRHRIAERLATLKAGGA
jgi:phage shock protein A